VNDPSGNGRASGGTAEVQAEDSLDIKDGDGLQFSEWTSIAVDWRGCRRHHHFPVAWLFADTGKCRGAVVDAQPLRPKG
jgi:hypothetical protein